ncbi:bromodomain, putative transposase, Ptta/En/Spm [Artemisia annua]|uniref:Bromodomain, putative transposase, Ptta/En/Spm n=1 Tax=Artemisia annua TaxID=35608 RepID=A0A2U1NHZ1_ARTAN|nr:bromodomain, putative transposase, Ptta/En/Spm [Artemisia annua]
MKRTRAYKEPPPKPPMSKNTSQSYAALVEETGTSTSFRPPPRSVSNMRTQENINSLHTRTESVRSGAFLRGDSRQTNLETGKTVYGGVDATPNALGEMIATIIKEISHQAGGLGNMSRSLVGNPVSHGQINESRVDMDLEENESPLQQNPEYKQHELNAALMAIRKTMKLEAAGPFNTPVDPVALEIPDYFEIIDNPMDFGTICNNLENGLEYMNSSDVFKDVEYIWYNCLKYNNKGEQILELMKRVKAYFMKNWKAAGLHPGPSLAIPESPISRHSKRENRDGLNQVMEKEFTPISKNSGHPGQLAEKQFTPINMQSSSQPETSSDEDEAYIDRLLNNDWLKTDSTIVKKKSQGERRTHRRKIIKTARRIEIMTNELGQPVGPEASKLTTFLGITARDGNSAPLIYPSWVKMPEEYKENMWQKVLTTFDIDPSCRSWVLMSIRSKWRNFKSHLKSNYYDKYATDEERLANRDHRVLPDQWSFLVSQWSSDKWQHISATNKANRAKVKFIHTSGTKSFARLREEERAKRPDGQEPSRAELFVLTRTNKNGQPVNEETAAVIAQLRERKAQKEETSINNDESDDDYDRILGREKKGGMSIYGTEISTRAQAIKMVTRKNSEIVEMKERLKTVEETCSQMASQMSEMVSMMATMQKAFLGGNIPNAIVATSVPVGIPNQSEPACTSNHEVPEKVVGLFVFCYSWGDVTSLPV